MTYDSTTVTRFWSVCRFPLLERVQNAAACLLLGLSRRDHVRPALTKLHWLPIVCYRIQFKLALVMFTIHTHRCPDYLTDSVMACNSDPARTRLRSASSTDKAYTFPRTRTKFSDKAFSVAGPAVWNSLPSAVREADSSQSFKCKLKTYLVRPSRTVVQWWMQAASKSSQGEPKGDFKVNCVTLHRTVTKKTITNNKLIFFRISPEFFPRLVWYFHHSWASYNICLSRLRFTYWFANIKHPFSV